MHTSDRNDPVVTGDNSFSSLLDILQLSDSFFPTGMYTMSNGLEALFYAGKIKEPKDITDLIKVYLEYQLGPADCVGFGNSYRFIENKDLQKLIEIDHIIFSIKLVEEIRNASTRSGTQLIHCLDFFSQNKEFLKSYSAAVQTKKAHGVYPVAFAVACSSFDIPKENACTMMLYSFTVSIVGAALRLGLTQHFEGQKIIHDLKPVILRAVRENIDKPIESIWQFAPQIDLCQIDHEKMDSKMFIT
jgi:urease accessory protein